MLVPSGVLGLGFDRKALAAGVDAAPDIIAIDGGSTDSGPHALGTGTSKYSRAACKSEWRDLLLAREKLGVPLVIGSAGTCGTDATVDWMLEITRELATELQLNFQICCVYTEQAPQFIAAQLEHDAISALEPSLPLERQTAVACSHIVALAGAEHIQAALKTGADVVIAGRTTDTAIISALPLMLGCDSGAAWHAAKIAECGALCSTNPTSGVVIVDITMQDGFTIYPAANNACCTPESVSAHMLYENTDPFILYEPGGYLDVTHAHYSAVSEVAVKVTESQWHSTMPYTVKLEGARLVGYQTTLLATLRDPHYVSHARPWIDRLSTFIQSEVRGALELSDDKPDDHFIIDFRLIGEDATLGKLETQKHQAHELGVLVIITAASQSLADEIGKFVNPFLLHYPLTDDEPLPTFAFPYSPAQSSRGPLYEFCINHVMAVDDPMSIVRLQQHRLEP